MNILTILKTSVIIILAALAFTVSTYAQDTASVKPTGTLQCPEGYVCITIEQAKQALIDSETVKNQAAQIAAQETRIAGCKDEIATLRVELAKLTGEKTGSDQMVVRLTAIIDFMMKNGRTKKYGIIVF